MSIGQAFLWDGRVDDRHGIHSTRSHSPVAACQYL